MALKSVLFCAAVSAWLIPALSWAQGINTNVALPVAKGEGISRTQLRWMRASDDPSPLDRKIRTAVAPQTLVLGLTPELSLFATLPVLLHQKVDRALGRQHTDPAFGDVTLLARQMLYVDDYGALSTRRVALLAGIKLPTGADRFGTQTFDPIVGGVATWAANRHELDVDGLYTLGTRRHGRETGDRLRYDIAYRYRLWPDRFGPRLLQLNAVLELNGVWAARSRLHGRTLRDSGGSTLFLSPGIQLTALRWILEASLQLPIAQNLKGQQVETDFIAVLSVRIPFQWD